MSRVDDLLALDYNERGLILLARTLERERDEATSGWGNERADNKRLRLLLRGITDEHFHLNVTIDPSIFVTKDTLDAVQYLVKHHAKVTAHELEQKLGGPLRRLQEALMHIHYLENHARSRGLQFTEWAVTERDKELWY